MKAQWFRFYSEVISDRKLAAVASITSQPHVVIVGVWATVLCLANDSPIRGTLLLTEDRPIRIPELAGIMGVDRDMAERIVSAFVDLGMLHDDDGTITVTAWNERQFVSDHNAERMAKSRSRRSDVTVTSQGGNCDVSETETETESIATKNVVTDKPSTTNEKKQSRDGAEKTPSVTRQIQVAFEKSCGYPVVWKAGNGEAAKWLANNGYTAAQVSACYAHMRGQAFWRDKTIGLPSIAKQIGEYVKQHPTADDDGIDYKHYGMTPSGKMVRVQ